MTPYDTAIHALAPYLPDGWVAQEGEPNNFKKTFFTQQEPAMRGGYWQENDTCHRIDDPFVIPACTDWRTSLRQIRDGRVVEADPTKENKGGGDE